MRDVLTTLNTILLSAMFPKKVLLQVHKDTCTALFTAAIAPGNIQGVVALIGTSSSHLKVLAWYSVGSAREEGILAFLLLITEGGKMLLLRAGLNSTEGSEIQDYEIRSECSPVISRMAISSVLALLEGKNSV